MAAGEALGLKSSSSGRHHSVKILHRHAVPCPSIGPTSRPAAFAFGSPDSISLYMVQTDFRFPPFDDAYRSRKSLMILKKVNMQQVPCDQVSKSRLPAATLLKWQIVSRRVVSEIRNVSPVDIPRMAILPLDYLRESYHPFLHWLGARQRCRLKQARTRHYHAGRGRPGFGRVGNYS